MENAAVAGFVWRAMLKNARKRNAIGLKYKSLRIDPPLGLQMSKIRLRKLMSEDINNLLIILKYCMNGHDVFPRP